MNKKKPSQTAYKVALNILALDSVPEMNDILPEGIVKTTEELLVASGVLSKSAARRYRSTRMVSILKALDWIAPGQFKAFGYRKAFFEQQIREGIKSGATQVLLLGAGYDVLGYLWALSFPKVNFFEIDEPATATIKNKGINSLGKPDNLQIISEDLSRHKLVDVLKSNYIWSTSGKTIIIAEGLLMYLPSLSVQDLLEQCATITGAESRFAFSFIGKDKNNKPDAGRLLLWSLKKGGEPWLWYANREEVVQLLNETGWKYSFDLVGKNKKMGIELFGAAIRV